MFKQIKFNKIKEFVTNKKQKKHNFSSETQSSNSNNIDYLDSQNLENLTVKELKKVAKEHRINLKGKRKKADIKQSIETFFLTKNRPSDIEVISPKFPIVSDSKTRVNISLWFRDDRRSTGYNRLKRFLESRDVICYTKDGVFVVHQLVLLAGSYLNDELFYDIYDFYLVSKPAEIRK